MFQQGLIGLGTMEAKKAALYEDLVGAVGIESNDVRNFKDLRGMLRNTKLLKRNKRARKGTLIAPSKLPRFSSVADILNVDFCTHCLQLRSASCPRIAARMASRLFA
jgi:hypothetical protein